MVFCILRLTPLALLRRPQLCMKQLYAVKDGVQLLNLSGEVGLGSPVGELAGRTA